MANESYEDFARALQTEYEEDCGVTFGKVPITALAKLTRVVDGEEQPIGRDAAEAIRAALVEQKMLDADGRIQPAFDPKRPGLQARAARRHTATLRRPWSTCWPRTRSSGTSARDRTRASNRLKKEVTLSPEFQALWDRIKPKTTYRVEFETDVLVRRAVDAIKRMEKIEAPKIRVTAGQLERREGRRDRHGRERRRGTASNYGSRPSPTCWPTCRTRPN